MYVIRTRNVHQALPEGVYQLASKGIPSPSRYGDVTVFPEPVTTVYECSTERVLFWAERDANPFFHLFESLWMLNGRRDVAFVSRFAKRMTEFSDDGERYHGAYGYRWRNHWGFDQIARLLDLLRNKPLSRRGVIGMWDPAADLHDHENIKDIPCNTQLYVWNQAGRLQMTVTCRSNDMVWGAYGSNAVHFSMLQEYLASMLALEVGTFYQISNNFHAYHNSFAPVRDLQQYAKSALYKNQKPPCPYEVGQVIPYPLVQDPTSWDLDLALFMEDPSSNGFRDPFFSRVAKPLWFAHVAYKKKDFAQAHELVSRCEATDWARACGEWLVRREVKAHEPA